MSNNNKMSDELLYAWVDGEAGKRSAEVRDFVDNHPDAKAKVEELRAMNRDLNALIDAGVGEVEPLMALSKIRQRIDAHKRRTIAARLAAWWDDVTMFHKKGLFGLAMAAALGALCAPGVMWLLRDRLPAAVDAGGGVNMASVVVESLEVGGDAKAVVMQANSGTTTLIWVSPAGGPAGNQHDAQEY
jgi:anti-sigma factor RsiW